MHHTTVPNDTMDLSKFTIPQPTPHPSVITPHIAYYFRNQRDIANGLMGVRHLAPDSVALFDMGRNGDHKFYMKNTLIPLDIIFVRDDGLVVGTLENMMPHDITPKGIDAFSRYVLEAPAGYVSQNNVLANVTAVQWHYN